jgi:hypothetical protein
MLTRLTSALAFLGGGTLWFSDRAPTVVSVNKNKDMLSEWPSEALGGTIPDCDFFNGTVRYSADLCSHLAISRSANTPTRAATRAFACAALASTECVLSSEVGYAIPTVFLYDHATYSITTVVAPKLLPRESPIEYVRVAPPDGDGLTDTFTVQFNTSIRVEFLDGISKQLREEEYEGEAAFCVQLLRHSYEPSCWEKLD